MSVYRRSVIALTLLGLVGCGANPIRTTEEKRLLDTDLVGPYQKGGKCDPDYMKGEPDVTLVGFREVSESAGPHCCYEATFMYNGLKHDHVRMCPAELRAAPCPSLSELQKQTIPEIFEVYELFSQGTVEDVVERYCIYTLEVQQG